MCPPPPIAGCLNTSAKQPNSAIETDDYAGALANIKKNGAQILEERFNNGRHVCWVAAPDGAQMELIEKV
jgi:hypothetical protein